MIMVDITKLTAALVTTEIGKISLGKYTFFTILALAIITPVDCVTIVVKNVQGIKPTHRNIT